MDILNNSSNKTINRERFIRIVEKRVNKILDNLDSLGNCSNRKNYEYSEKDVKKIFGELEKKIKEIKIKFQERPNEKDLLSAELFLEEKIEDY